VAPGKSRADYSFRPLFQVVPFFWWRRLEKWFWRAMDADNDNLDACNKKLLWLEPKWHGSPEEMLEFARTCRDTKNWSSGIPLLLAEAHHRLAGDLSEAKRFDYMSHPDVWQEIRGVYVEYLGSETGTRGE
jgi:hypothetical protein